jgi:hypothetical protein
LDALENTLITLKEGKALQIVLDDSVEAELLDALSAARDASAKLVGQEDANAKKIGEQAEAMKE